MGKKIVTLFTMIAFIIFSMSCYYTKKILIKPDTDLEGKVVKVVKLQMNSGENIEFPKTQTAQISSGTIIGNLIFNEYIVDKSNIKKTRIGQRGKIIRITTRDGKIINVASVKEERDRIIIVGYEYSHIPLSEIAIIWVKKTNTIGAIFLVLFGFSFVILAFSGFKFNIMGNWDWEMR